jgi:DNA end-binding protein Ku
MYYADEVRSMENFGTDKVEVKEAELKVAHQLIDALADKFEPERFHDTYEENLRKLIDARLEGKDVSTVERPAKLAPVVDLMDALKQSLSRMEGKKSSEVASEARKASQVTEISAGVPKKGPGRAKPKRGRAA